MDKKPTHPLPVSSQMPLRFHMWTLEMSPGGAKGVPVSLKQPCLALHQPSSCRFMPGSKLGKFPLLSILTSHHLSRKAPFLLEPLTSSQRYPFLAMGPCFLPWRATNSHLFLTSWLVVAGAEPGPHKAPCLALFGYLQILRLECLFLG